MSLSINFPISMPIRHALDAKIRSVCLKPMFRTHWKFTLEFQLSGYSDWTHRLQPSPPLYPAVLNDSTNITDTI